MVMEGNSVLGREHAVVYTEVKLIRVYEHKLRQLEYLKINWKVSRLRSISLLAN